MFESFFRPLNAYLLSHPSFLAKLKLLFWLKYWTLTLLMAFFVYLIFRERGFSGGAQHRKLAALRRHHSLQSLIARSGAVQRMPPLRVKNLC